MAQIYIIQIYPYLSADFTSAGFGTLYGEDFPYGILHDPRTRNCFVLSPKLEMQLCKSGSMTFTVTKENPFYNAVRNSFRWEAAVFREDSAGKKTFVWAGYPVTRETDLYGQSTFTLEGVLSYLNNIYIPAFSFTDILPSEFIGSILQYHKKPIVASYQEEKTDLFSAFRVHNTFGIGNCTDFDTESKQVHSYTDAAGNEHFTIIQAENKIKRYTQKALTAMEALQTRLVDYFGGNLYITMNTAPNNERYAMWNINYEKLSENNVCSQSIRIGENATAIYFTADMTDFCTAIVPVDSSGNALCSNYTYGNKVSISDGTGNEIAYCSASNIIFQNIALADRFGIITSQFQFETETDAIDTAEMTGKSLLAAAQLQPPSIEMEVMAQDLSFLTGNENDVIKIGQRIPVYGDLPIETMNGTSTIFLQKDKPVYFYVEKLSMALDDPKSNAITLNGNPKTFTGK